MEEEIHNYLPTVMCRGTPCISGLSRACTTICLGGVASTLVNIPGRPARTSDSPCYRSNKSAISLLPSTVICLSNSIHPPLSPRSRMFFGEKKLLSSSVENR